MEELRRYLNGLGACNMKWDIDSLESAILMMFTPQGREFCIQAKFPTLSFLRKHKKELNAISGVFIDKGFVETHEHNVIAAGNTTLSVIADKPDAIYKPIAIGLASIVIHASNYAVVTATDIYGDKITEYNDGTAKVTIER